MPLAIAGTGYGLIGILDETIDEKEVPYEIWVRPRLSH